MLFRITISLALYIYSIVDLLLDYKLGRTRDKDFGKMVLLLDLLSVFCATLLMVTAFGMLV